MKKVIFLLLFPILLTATLLPETEFSGYFENRFFLIFQTIKSDTENNGMLIGDYNRLRLKLNAVPSKKVKLNLAVDFFSFHGSILSPAGVNENLSPNTGSGEDIKIDLDRAYADIYFKNFDLSIGKQRVAMGVSYLWAPLDIFNRVNFMEPKEEKPGVNALKVYAPIGKDRSVTAVFLPDNDPGSSGKALRFKWTLFNIDAGLTYINRYRNYNNVYGLDLRGENFIGWWFEYGYFRTLTGDSEKLVIGMDYTFPIGKGVYWMSEYFFDGSGEPDHTEYDYELLKSGERFILGNNYLFSMLRYGVSDFASLSVSYIGNVKDGSFILNPSFSYELFENVSLLTGVYIPMGKTGGEFNNQNIGAFFLWLKINF
ncbi:MAG: hypothetical protein ABFR36_03885 [Acidobacteriota bacterium]